MTRRKPKPSPRAKAVAPAAVTAAATAPAGPWRRRLARFGTPLGLLVIVVFAFVIRVVPARDTVFPAPGEVRLMDTDSYYHLRHARLVAEHFPKVQRFDTVVYPGGLPSLYAGLYDIAIAAAGKITGDLERAAAYTPAVVGALVYLALFWLGRVAAGPGTGLLAALLLTLAPGIFLARSLLGYADHHVAENLLGLATAAGLTRGLQAGARPWWRPAVLPALPLSLFLFTWFGAPIYVGMCALTFFLVATVVVARGEPPMAVARAATRYALGTLAVIVPAWLILPWLVMEPLVFKISLAALVLLAGGLPLYALAARAALARRVPPPLVALGGLAVAAGGFVAATLVSPLLAHEILGVKSALVEEQLGMTAGEYLQLGGAAAALAFLALPLAVADAWRGRDERFALAPVLLGSMMVALWLRTHDYGYAAPPYLAFLAALVLVRAGRRRPTLVAALAASALIVPIWPLRWQNPPIAPRSAIRPLVVLDDGWAATMRWMKEHTPQGRYGVRAFWDFGHFVAGLAERPVLALGQISQPIASWYLMEDEEQAFAASRAVGDVRYVIADAQTASGYLQSMLVMVGADLGDFQEARPGGLWAYNARQKRTMIARLFDRDGDGLAHYRLVYASAQVSAVTYVARPEGGQLRVARKAIVITPQRLRAWEKLAASRGPSQTTIGTVYEAAVEPSVKVFEEVNGAHLAGSAAPGATVEATVPLRALTAGRDLAWHRTVTADATGRFDLLVPYPTEADPSSDVVARGPYELRSGDRLLGSAPVRVEDVRSGATVAPRP